ncbi:MAG: 6,7-dimethyl-8-ribityllumazine synthase [Bacteroidales bacterium]|nr:6,7-dimethyl-8-ribityllumazine synthase [Bacteroidales bacterium]
MATVNLSNYDINSVPNATGMRFGIVVSEWNNKITETLYNGAYNTLIKHGAKPENILKEYVPGTFELTYGAKSMIKSVNIDAVIVLGCVIQGETRHFDFICQGIAFGITDLNIVTDTPVIFGVLTTDNKQQASDRAGGKHGNKGDEAAVTAVKMAALRIRHKNL